MGGAACLDVSMKQRAISTDQLRAVWQNRQRGVYSVPIGALVRALVKSEGLDRPNAIRSLRGTWEELVGPELSRHSQLDGFRRGTLRVRVDSAAHMAELQVLVRAGLAEWVAAKFDQRPVSSIRLRLGEQVPRQDRCPKQQAKSKRKDSRAG